MQEWVDGGRRGNNYLLTKQFAQRQMTLLFFVKWILIFAVDFHMICTVIMFLSNAHLHVCRLQNYWGDPEPPASDGPNCGYERKCPLKKVSFEEILPPVPFYCSGVPVLFIFSCPCICVILSVFFLIELMQSALTNTESNPTGNSSSSTNPVPVSSSESSSIVVVADDDAVADDVNVMDGLADKIVHYCVEHNIEDGVEILRYFQKVVVQGRALRIQDSGVVEEGDTNFIMVDRYNILETAFE